MVGAERHKDGELRVAVESGGVPAAAALFAGNGRALELHEGAAKRRVVSARCGIEQRWGLHGELARRRVSAE